MWPSLKTVESATRAARKHGLHRALKNTFDYCKMIENTLELIERDRLATLAALVLRELVAEEEQREIRASTYNATHDLVDALKELGYINKLDATRPYLERGCLEHGVVHLGFHPRWLQIDPVTGSVEVF